MLFFTHVAQSSADTEERDSQGFLYMGLTLQSPASAWDHRDGLQHPSTSLTHVWLFPKWPLQLPEQMGQVQGRPRNTGSNWKSCPCFPVAATSTKGGCDVKAGVKARSHQQLLLARSRRTRSQVDVTVTQWDQQKYNHFLCWQRISMCSDDHQAVCQPPLWCLKSSHLSPCKPG